MPLKVPASTKKDTEEANADLYISVKAWLKKHGKLVKHKITERQKADAAACFRLMDSVRTSTQTCLMRVAGCLPSGYYEVCTRVHMWCMVHGA